MNKLILILIFRENTKTDKMEAEVTRVTVLQRADPAKQESLVCENKPDPMDAEQTWPTEDEIAAANQEVSVMDFVGDAISCHHINVGNESTISPRV